MKLIPSAPRAIRLGSLVLLAAGLATASLFAGPGVQHWQTMPDRTPPSARIATPADSCTGCPGVKWVDVAVTRPTWPNGRGPLATTLEAREEPCRVCTGSSVARMPEWPNRRGPLMPVVAPAPTPTQPVATAINDRRS